MASTEVGGRSSFDGGTLHAGPLWLSGYKQRSLAYSSVCYQLWGHVECWVLMFIYLRGPAVVSTRADQNTGGELLEFPMRTAMHGKSRVSSAICVCHN